MRHDHVSQMRFLILLLLFYCINSRLLSYMRKHFENRVMVICHAPILLALHIYTYTQKHTKSGIREKKSIPLGATRQPFLALSGRPRMLVFHTLHNKSVHCWINCYHSICHRKIFFDEKIADF